MAIQSSINSLLSQAQSLAAFYTGFKKADDIIKDTTATKNEAKIQTEIAAGNAPMKDGKVDPEWIQKRREQHMFNKSMFRSTGELTAIGAMRSQRILSKIEKGEELGFLDRDFIRYPKVQEYLKSFNESTAAKVLSNKRVVERTDSINQTKSNFDEHIASLIRYYGKGSGNP